MPLPTETKTRAARIVVAHDAETLMPYVEAWIRLAGEAAEPNVYYEPALLLAALRNLAGDADLRIVLVLSPGPETGTDRLVGLFPLERCRGYHGVPISQLRFWQHLHCFLTTPLVAADSVEFALEAFLTYLADQDAKLIEWGALGADGPVYEALRVSLRNRGLACHETRSFERAVLERGESAERYIEANLRRSRKKGHRRNRRKLEEEGASQLRRLPVGEDPLPWLEAFLALEASGWKGREGTAMQQMPSERQSFMEAACEAARRNQLIIVGLELEGRFIAMQCNFRAACTGGASFSFKMAYDETFARFGPGLLLEVGYIEAFHADGSARWEDSCCAEPGAPVEEFWGGRRRIVSLEASTSRGIGRLIAEGMPVLRRGLHRFRRLRLQRRSRKAA